MQYTEENCISEVLKEVPGFQLQWDEHQDFWDGEPAGLIVDMIEFASYTKGLLENNQENELEKIFIMIEKMLSEGSEQVKDAVATGFLESTINPVVKDTVYLPLLARLLGKESKKYCIEWLKFSGAELPGFSNVE